MQSRFRRSLRGGRVRQAVLVGIVGAAVGACGQEATTSVPSADVEKSMGATQSAPEASTSVPAGWGVMEDDAGALRVALPADFVRIEGFPGVSAQLVTEPPMFTIEVHAAAAPALQPPKPWTKSVLETWLLERAGQWTGGQMTDVETSVVQLPVGEAIQLRGQLLPGGPDVIGSVAYAIPTPSGLAELHILALPEYWETRGDDLALIPRLMELGE